MLSKQILLKSLNNMPNSSDNVSASEELAKAFSFYYKDAMAADTIMVPNSMLFAFILLGKMGSSGVLETLGSSIREWSLLWVWNSATFTGAPGTTIVNGALLDSLLVSFIRKVAKDKTDPPKDNLRELSDIIHNWSTSNIQVTLTNNQSGNTGVVPVV